MGANRTQRVAVQTFVKKEVHDRLRAIAEDRDWPMHVLLRELIEGCLPGYEQSTAPAPAVASTQGGR